MKRLLLVDGSSYLYRAFHAMPDLRNRAGEPTGAIYGMVNMLRRLRTDFAHDAFANNAASTHCSACVFDAPGPTFRDAIFPQYKANRSSMPEDLAAQIPHIHDVTRALGWPVLQQAGIEADDIIGTLACMALAQGFDEVVISTGDKDMAQLVNERICLVDTMKNVVMTRDAVFEKFGVYPERIVDFLSLMGDTSDNVPGVDGVGPKTAAKWITQYGSLDAIVEQAHEVGGKVGEKLRLALPWLPTARTLVTIKTDCDLSALLPQANLEAALPAQAEDTQALIPMFARFEFKTWLRAATGDTAAAAAPYAQSTKLAQPGSSFAPTTLPEPGFSLNTPLATVSSLNTVCINTEAALHTLLADLHQCQTQGTVVAFDTETTSLHAMQAQLVGIALAWQVGTGYYIPLQHQDLTTPQLALDEVLDALRPWLENPQATKVAQNAKYDCHVLANHGVVVRGVVDDTLLASYVLEAHKSHGLDALAQRWLHYQTVAYEDVVGKGVSQKSFADIGVDVATRYAAEDAEVTWRLRQVLRGTLNPHPELTHVYEAIELPFAQVLLAVERYGVLVDVPKLEAHSDELATKLLTIEEEAYALAGGLFNLNSPKQIAELLFTRLQLPVVKKTAGGTPSTDEEVLAKLAEDYPLPAKLLEHRTLAKLKSTYTDKLPRMVNPHTGRVHTNYAQAVAVTGRLASNEPNLQNIPVRTAQGRRVREAFIAAPGHVLLSADYSQIELRIMAHISGDEALIKAFESGQDVHRATAAEIFGVDVGEVNSEQRRTAKVINFGLIYGMSAFGLAANLKIGRDAAKLYIDRYFTRYPGVAHYMEHTRQEAKAKGYVSTVFGRRLWLPEINSPNGPRRAAAERAAINAPMQGTSADLIKMAMIAVHEWLLAHSLASRMVMQVHDEMVLEVPQHELAQVQAEVPRLMASVAALRVPLEVGCGVGLNWEAAH